jgi:hypothetical protein
MRKLWDAFRRRKPASPAEPPPAEHRHEMYRHLPFPFENDRFPDTLGAVIQRTVLEGHEPAREVIHSADNSWLVGDGINDPNEPGAVVAACMLHVIEQNSSVTKLATLPLGHAARRDNPGRPWVIEPYDLLD